MKTDYKKLSNKELEKLINDTTQHLIEMRNEMSKRKGEQHDIVNYDFTKRVTD